MSRSFGLLLWLSALDGVSSKFLAKNEPFEMHQSLMAVESSKVHVEFFVMSKCPDAVVCEQAFGPVLKELASAVNASFGYIGYVQDGSAVCMHGPSECAGDIQQLCAQEAGNTKQFMDFLSCHNENRTQIPDSGQDCFTRAGYDPEQMKQCSSGKEGMDMLLKSIGDSESRGIGLSCTVLINGKGFCEHDVDWVNCGECDSYADKGACLRDKLCKMSPGAC